MSTDSLARAIAMGSLTGAVQMVASRSAVAALALSAVGLFDGSPWTFVAGDLSAQVTADTQQGAYIAPRTDVSGKSGAFVRQREVSNWYNVAWFGTVGNDVIDDYAAIQCCFNVAKLTGGTIWFPAGLYRIYTGLLLSLVADGSLNIAIKGTPGSWLRTGTAIDALTISNTNAGAANTRRVSIDGLAILVGSAAARGLVLTKASYNQFSNMEFLGAGTAIVCGTTSDTNTIHNQFANMRPQQVGQGLYLGGQYNIATNFVCGEGITGQYAIQFDGLGNIVDGFAVRGAGGAGGLATVNFTSSAPECVLANGVVFDSYAIGVNAGAARNIKVKAVTIATSQTHGLQLNGTLQGEFDVTIQNSNMSAGTGNHVNCANTPTDNTVNAQFVGTQPALDINEASGTNNIWTCGTLPNGATINGTGSILLAGGNLATKGAITSASPTAGIGYAIGARGAATQATSKATGVASNTVVTDITLNAAALAAATTVSFVFTNSAIGANDQLILNHVATGTFGSYALNAHGFAAGSCTIDLRNVSAASLSEAIVIRAVVIKGG